MRTSRMLMLLGAALLALTTARCNCGHDDDLGCSTLGDTRCYSGNTQWYPHGAVYQTCIENEFDPGNPAVYVWNPEFCYVGGDGSGPFNCRTTGLTCWSGYCYCPPVH